MRRLLLILALTLTAATAHAAGELPGYKPAGAPTMPKPLEEQQARGAQVYYLGKYDQLDGWVMMRTGQPEFYYATPGNKALVMGILFDGIGNMLTGDQVKALENAQIGAAANTVQSPLPAPGAAKAPDTVPPAPVTPAPDAPAVTAPAPQATGTAPAESAAGKTQQAAQGKGLPDTAGGRMLGQVQQAAHVRWGNANTPAFWAFIDPNCEHCQYFLQQVEPYVAAGQISVELVMVGYDQRSKSQAMLALTAKDGPARLIAYAKGDKTMLPESTNMDTRAVNENVELMRRWNLKGTPMIVYQSGKDGKVRLIRGRPLDMVGAVSDLKG